MFENIECTIALRLSHQEKSISLGLGMDFKIFNHLKTAGVELNIFKYVVDEVSAHTLCLVLALTLLFNFCLISYIVKFYVKLFLTNICTCANK